MKSLKAYYAIAVNLPNKQPKRTVRKDLNADAMLKLAMKEFRAIEDHRADNSKIPLCDALMSALAMFHLKDQSLLGFDDRRQEEPENMHSLYGIGQIPCDSRQMRTILDEVELSALRPVYRSIFKKLQRGKNLEAMTYLADHYLISADGSGYYSSSKVSSPYCMRKVTRKGEIKYYQQMYAAPGFILTIKRLSHSSRRGLPSRMAALKTIANVMPLAASGRNFVKIIPISRLLL